MSSFSEFIRIIPQTAQDWRGVLLYLVCIGVFAYVLLQRNRTLREVKAIDGLSGQDKNDQISIVLRRYPFLNKEGMNPAEFLSFTKARYTFVIQIVATVSILAIVCFLVFIFFTKARVESEIGPAVSEAKACNYFLISCANAQTTEKKHYFNSDPCSLDFGVETRVETDTLKLFNVFPYRAAVVAGQIVTTYQCLFPVKLYSQSDNGLSPYKISVRHLNQGFWSVAPAKIKWKISQFTPDQEVIFISHFTGWITKDVPITLENIGSGKLKNFQARLVLLKNDLCKGYLRQARLRLVKSADIESSILNINDKVYDGQPIVEFEVGAIRIRPPSISSLKAKSYCMYLTANYDLLNGEPRTFRLLSEIVEPDGLGAPGPPDTTYNVFLDPSKPEGSLNISRIVEAGKLDHYQIRFDTKNIGLYKLDLSVEDLGGNTIARRALTIDLWKPSYAFQY